MKSAAFATLAALAPLALLGSGLAQAAQPPARRALVVAYNGSNNPSLPPLRFADDDGVLWTETLERLGIETTLLTVADVDTARAGSPVLSRARPPTREAVDQAVTAIHAANARDRAAGREADVLFIYVGHGLTDEAGRSSLTLVDGSLDRSALYGLLDRLGADYVHVLVDACNAAGVLGIRGADPEVLGRLRAVLDQEKLGARPNMGAIFADSADGETHEWSLLRAGVFSHAARSGLLGAADVNGDGVIEYSELDAFVAASLAGVKSVKTRIFARTMPPSADPHRPLAGPPPPGPTVELARLPESRVSVEDDLGVRLADVHRAPGEAVRLALPARDAYWLRTPTGEVRIALAQLGRELPALGPLGMATRGPAEESMRRGFFTVPYGRQFYEGYVASATMVPVRFQQPEPEVSRSAPTPGLGLLVAGTVGQPALGAKGVSVGTAVSWRAQLSLLRVGGRASWSMAPSAQLWSEGASIQRASACAVVGLEGPWTVAPYGELGLGWLLVLAARSSATQGDGVAGTGRLSAGVRWEGERLNLRLGASLDADFLKVAREQQLYWTPGAEVGIGF